MSKKNGNRNNYNNDNKPEDVTETEPINGGNDEFTEPVQAAEAVPTEESDPNPEEKKDSIFNPEPIDWTKKEEPVVVETPPEKTEPTIEHADLTQPTMAKDIEEEKKVQPPEIENSTPETTIKGISKGYGAGQKIRLKGARVYASATSESIKRIAKGEYYIFDGKTKNGRVSISTKSSAETKYIIGWVEVNYIFN